MSYHLTLCLLPSVNEPIYGIYILNRMGTGDYVKRIYPEDDLEVFGKYLMYRYYPEFTEQKRGLEGPKMTKFRLLGGVQRGLMLKVERGHLLVQDGLNSTNGKQGNWRTNLPHIKP